MVRENAKKILGLLLVRQMDQKNNGGEDSGNENASPDADKNAGNEEFLNKLSSMYERVKIYNEAFYDRQPRYVHISPKKMLTTV